MSSEKPVHVPRDQYPEAMYPQVITSAGGEYEDQEEVHFLDYWRVIVARRWTIFAILATSVALTMIYTLKQTPIYRAIASIQIDRENPNILSFKDIYQVETASDDALRTQVEVLKSRSLARRVVEDLKLHEKEEFQPQDRGVVAAMIASVKEMLLPKPAE
jgi:uncharacterized protein involved in exopolysaccharide biosynthesis